MNIIQARTLNRRTLITKHKFKGKLSDSFTNYNYVGNTKVSVSIKKNLSQQMHIKRDISN